MADKVNCVLRRVGEVVGETAESRHDPEGDYVIDTQHCRARPITVIDLDPMVSAVDVERPTLAAHHWRLVTASTNDGFLLRSTTGTSRGLPRLERYEVENSGLAKCLST